MGLAFDHSADFTRSPRQAYESRCAADGWGTLLRNALRQLFVLRVPISARNSNDKRTKPASFPAAFRFFAGKTNWTKLIGLQLLRQPPTDSLLRALRAG